MEIKDIIKKETIIIGLFGFFTFIYSLFTVKAYQVSQFARGSTWNTGGPGTYLPWPNEPGHLMIITEMNPVDAIINQIFIETGLLALSSLLLWCIFLFNVYKIAKKIF
jgi:hypothetical protein